MSNNRQIAHLWANKSREHGRGSHFYFEDGTIYSYGSHFPIARHIERNGAAAVLFTTRGYSNSTARHISYTRRALYELALTVFNVEFPRNAPRSEDYRAEYLARVKAHTASAAAARSQGPFHIERAMETAKEANECAAFFGWRWKITPDISAETIAKAKAAHKKASIERAKQNAERERARGILLATAVTEWRAGKAGNLPYDYRGPTLLRVKGDTIQTSRGAEIPVSHAPRLWWVICAAKAGTPYRANGHSEHAGEFKVQSIDTDGTLTAGCHKIEYAELARLAADLRIG